MNKKHDSKSTEIALTTTENFIKSALDNVSDGIGAEIIKSIPFASSILAIGKAISNLKDARYHKNLVAFFYESEESEQFSKKFFEEKSNAEIGLEILSLVEQSYLEHQARMIARITRMWKQSKEISKEQFDEYANIILSLDNHLIREFEKYMSYKPKSSRAEFGIEVNQNGITFGNPINQMFTSPNMHFVVYGFLKQKTNPNTVIGGSLAKEGHYSITDKAHFFYNKIFKEQDNTISPSVNYNMF